MSLHLHSSGFSQSCPLLTLAIAVEAISSAASSRGWSRDISGVEGKQTKNNNNNYYESFSISH